jgi:DNA-binding protein HU-beta
VRRAKYQNSLVGFGLRTSRLAYMTSNSHCGIQPSLHRFPRNFEMNSSELASVVAEAHDIAKAQAQAILDSVLKSIVNAAASDGEVSLAGFGKFKVKASAEREGRNPANGEKIKIAASKKLSFSPAKAVKDVLNA